MRPVFDLYCLHELLSLCCMLALSSPWQSLGQRRQEQFRGANCARSALLVPRREDDEARTACGAAHALVPPLVHHDPHRLTAGRWALDGGVVVGAGRVVVGAGRVVVGASRELVLHAIVDAIEDDQRCARKQRPVAQHAVPQLRVSHRAAHRPGVWRVGTEDAVAH